MCIKIIDEVNVGLVNWNPGLCVSSAGTAVALRRGGAFLQHSIQQVASVKSKTVFCH